MTAKELKRRISDALLKGGLDKDAGLDAALAADADAKAYADDLVRLDGLLGEWPLPDRGDEGWEALATRIEQRVKDRVTAPGDLTLPPRFDEDDPFVREPSAFAPTRPGGVAPRAAVAAKPAAASPLAKPAATSPTRPALGAKLADAKPAAPATSVAKPAEPAASAAPAEPPPDAPIEVAVATPTAPVATETPATFAEPPPTEEAFEEKRITTEISVADLEKVSVPPPAATRPIQATEEIAVADLQKVSKPPAAAAQPATPDFSLANLGALEVKHAAPPPVPKTPPKHAAKTRAPEPKDDRATIPPVRQPLTPLGPLPDFSAAPLAVAPLKKSRAPLYGTLAVAATVAVAVGGWFTLQSTSRNAAPAVELAQRDEMEERAQGSAAPPPPTTTAQGAMPMQPEAAPAVPTGMADRGVGGGGMANAEQPATGTVASTPPAAPVAPPAIAAVTAADGTLGPDDQRARGGELDVPTDHAAHARPAHPPSGGAPPSGASGSDTHVAAHDAPHATGEGASPTTHHTHGGAAAATPAPHGDTPARDDVVRAMGTVHAAVQTCAAGRGGVAWVQVTFAGGTGRVSNALVQGQFAGTPQGSCIARAVRGAQVQPFGSPTFSVAYPFQL